jgi:hypothetical protein
MAVKSFMVQAPGLNGWGKYSKKESYLTCAQGYLFTDVIYECL